MAHLKWAFVLVILAASDVRGENLASCKETDCGRKECRIIERCWGKDCQVGTTCLARADIPPPNSPQPCPYENPVLTSLNGGTIEELTCGVNSLVQCPPGTYCLETAGICCTGVPKTNGQCPMQNKNYFALKGDCTTICNHDQECPGFELCCKTGIGCKKCMEPVPTSSCQTTLCSPGFHCIMAQTNCTSYPCFAMPQCVENKPGECPALVKQDQCVNQCEVDSHCLGQSKCCKAGGCKVCAVPPGFETPTSAPSAPADISNPAFVDTSGASDVGDYGTLGMSSDGGLGGGGGITLGGGDAPSSPTMTLGGGDPSSSSTLTLGGGDGSTSPGFTLGAGDGSTSPSSTLGGGDGFSSPSMTLGGGDAASSPTMTLGGGDVGSSLGSSSIGGGDASGTTSNDGSSLSSPTLGFGGGTDSVAPGTNFGGSGSDPSGGTVAFGDAPTGASGVPTGTSSGGGPQISDNVFAGTNPTLGSGSETPLGGSSSTGYLGTPTATSDSGAGATITQDVPTSGQAQTSTTSVSSGPTSNPLTNMLLNLNKMLQNKAPINPTTNTVKLPIPGTSTNPAASIMNILKGNAASSSIPNTNTNQQPVPQAMPQPANSGGLSQMQQFMNIINARRQAMMSQMSQRNPFTGMAAPANPMANSFPVMNIFNPLQQQQQQQQQQQEQQQQQQQQQQQLYRLRQLQYQQRQQQQQQQQQYPQYMHQQQQQQPQLMDQQQPEQPQNQQRRGCGMMCMMMFMMGT